MRVTIRLADQSDAPAIAAVHVTAWRETYRGILSDQTIERRTVAGRERFWTQALASGSTTVFVAEADGEIVGFGACGDARAPDLGASAEVYAVYVLKRFQYRGVGSYLMGTMAQVLTASGHEKLGLWVTRDNLAAIAFYRTLGASVGGSRANMRDGGESMAEMAMLWDNAADLVFWIEDANPLPRERMPRARDVRWPSAAAQRACRDVCRQA